MTEDKDPQLKVTTSYDYPDGFVLRSSSDDPIIQRERNAVIAVMDNDCVMIEAGTRAFPAYCIKINRQSLLDIQAQSRYGRIYPRESNAGVLSPQIFDWDAWERVPLQRILFGKSEGKRGQELVYLDGNRANVTPANVKRRDPSAAQRFIYKTNSNSLAGFGVAWLKSIGLWRTQLRTRSADGEPRLLISRNSCLLCIHQTCNAALEQSCETVKTLKAVPSEFKTACGQCSTFRGKLMKSGVRCWEITEEQLTAHMMNNCPHRHFLWRLKDALRGAAEEEAKQNGALRKEMMI